MRYYKIKIISPVERENKNRSITDKEKNLLSDIGLDYSSIDEDEEFNTILSKLKKKNNIFLNYTDKYGFSLVRESRGNMFSEEVLENDKTLIKYLSDKKYELIETSDEPRFMRYRMKE